MKQKKQDYTFVMYFIVFVFFIILYSPRLFLIYKYGITEYRNRRKERRQNRIKQFNKLIS